MQRPCGGTGTAVLFVGCQVENLLLSSSKSGSAPTPLCPEHYSLILIQEQPAAQDVRLPAPCVRDQTPAPLERGACRDSCFLIKVLKDERRGRKKMLMPGTLDYLLASQVQLF